VCVKTGRKRWRREGAYGRTKVWRYLVGISFMYGHRRGVEPTLYSIIEPVGTSARGCHHWRRLSWARRSRHVPDCLSFPLHGCTLPYYFLSSLTFFGIDAVSIEWSQKQKMGRPSDRAGSLNLHCGVRAKKRRYIRVYFVCICSHSWYRKGLILDAPIRWSNGPHFRSSRSSMAREAVRLSKVAPHPATIN
jgi:hypothetical protein